MRKPMIAGNWKMNKTPSEARELVSALVPLVQDAKCDVVVCTPAVDFAAVSEVIKGTNIKLGAENMHWKESGAYTGELSAAMLKESGVEYVILGHSERRQYFGETDATVNQRVLAAVKAGLTPIICVGEKKEEREAGYTNAGKSTLLNALTRSEVLAEDKLFATLDPTARQLTLHAARLRDGGKRFRAEASAAKLVASEAAVWCASEAVQICGGSGYLQGSVAERLYRDAKITQIYEGTNEIQKLVISGGLFR